jgi:anti-sigma B factor antagonist
MAELEVLPAAGPDGPVIVTMAGEFDLSNAAELRQCLSAFDDARSVVLDMAGVTFIDSTALAVLVVALNRGLRLSVTNASEFAHRVLTVSGLADRFGGISPTTR